MLSIFCNISPGWRGIRNLKKLIGSPQASWCRQHLLGAAEHLLLALQPHLQLPQLLVLLLAAVFRLLALCRHLNPEEPLVLTFNLTETSATCRLSWMQSSRFCTRTRNAWSWEGWQSGNPTTPRWAGRRSEPGENTQNIFWVPRFLLVKTIFGKAPESNCQSALSPLRGERQSRSASSGNPERSYYKMDSHCQSCAPATYEEPISKDSV